MVNKKLNIILLLLVSVSQIMMGTVSASDGDIEETSIFTEILIYEGENVYSIGINPTEPAGSIYCKTKYPENNFLKEHLLKIEGNVTSLSHDYNREYKQFYSSDLIAFSPNGTLYFLSSYGIQKAVEEYNNVYDSVIYYRPNGSHIGEFTFAPDGTIYITDWRAIYKVIDNKEYEIFRLCQPDPKSICSIQGLEPDDLKGAIGSIAFDSNGTLFYSVNIGHSVDSGSSYGCDIGAIFKVINGVEHLVHIRQGEIGQISIDSKGTIYFCEMGGPIFKLIKETEIKKAHGYLHSVKHKSGKYTWRRDVAIISNSDITDFQYNNGEFRLGLHSISHLESTALIIPKQMISSISDVEVFIDGNQAQYDHFTQNDAYVIRST